MVWGLRKESPVHTLRMLITNQMLAGLGDELHNWDLTKHVERREKTQKSLQTEWKETRSERERKGKRDREKEREKHRERLRVTEESESTSQDNLPFCKETLQQGTTLF